MASAIGPRILSNYPVILALFAVDAAQFGLLQEEAIIDLSFPLNNKPVPHPQEKPIKGNPQWVCLFPKWVIALKLKEMPLTVKNQLLISIAEAQGEAVAKIKVYHKLVFRVSTAVSLKMCPYTFQHQSPSDWPQA